MKKAKRALALALVFALVASFCVTGAAAAPGPGEQQTVVNGQYVGGEWQQGGTGSVTENGVTVSKTATATGDSNKYFVTLEVVTPVTTSTTSASAATVLVIDRSLSMGYCEECGEGNWHEWWCGYRDEGQNVQNNQTRLYAAQQAACTFLDNYRDETSTAPRYVAVVAFAGRNNTSTVVDWVNVNDAQKLQDAKNTINNLGVRSSTNLNAGLEEAEDLLNNNAIRDVPSGNRYVIALTDGAPTTEEANAIETASDIKNSATIYTVCFGASDEKVSWGGGWGSQGYEMYVSEYLSNRIATQPSLGSDEQFAFDADNAQELYDAFDQLTQSITEGLTGLTVTDPMAEGVTLETEFRGNSGVDITGGDIEWTLSNPDRDEQAGTDTYTLNYTVTVDPDAFKGQEAGYYPLNGETYMTIPGEHGQQSTTVQFPVPGVWVTPTVSETAQDVYVYVKVVGEAGNNGDLTDEELAEVREWGLTTLNKDGYFTIGKVSGCMLPATDAYAAGTNIYDDYSSAVNIGDIVRHAANEAFALDDVEWYTLHTASGATDYSEVSSDTLCWHLDGRITIEDLEKRLVTVTYTDGIENDVVFADQERKVIPGYNTPAFDGTPEYAGYTFTGWQSSLDGETYTDEQLDEMTVTQNVIYTAQWSRNAGNITIEVYLDGDKVELTDDTHLKNYISNLTDDAGTPTFTYTVEGGVVNGTYNYEQFDSADIVLTPNSDYILQGIEGTFIQGNNAWQGITQSGDGWKIDNVMGESTLEVYLNTKYSVEYKVPEGFEAPTDSDVYVTGEGVENANMAEVTDNEGAERSWVNSNLNTSITIEPLPTGTTGWTDEATPTGTHDKDDEIGVATAVTGGLDADGDNTFTFTATAVNYTVTYTDGVDGEEVFPDQVTSDIKYGAETPAFDGTPSREGYSFAGWDPTVAEKVTGDATYTATWTADEDTAYTVEYYFENLEDDGFTIDDSQTVNGSGTTGDKVEAEQKEFAGFTFDAGNEDNVTSGTIAGDGSLVLKLYYVRETYTVTYTDGVDGEEVFENQVTSDIKYGAATPEFDGTPEREGYTFTGWEPEVAATVTGNATYEAQWEEITGTLTVTKTFSGLDEGVLPSNFAITVAKDGETVKTLELKDAQVNGTTYTWTINDLSLGTYTVSESGYDVEGYAFDEDESTTSVDATLVEGETVAATAELKNVYIKDEPGLSVEKTVHSVNGSTDIPEKVEVDDVIVYKIVVENTGNVALTGISVTDTLGGEPLTVYTDATCETEATAFDLAVDETKELYATYTVEEADAGSTLTNTATAEAEDGTEGSDDVPVEVKKQYTLTVKYYYDEASGEPFKTEEYTLNEGDSWRVSTETGATHVAPGTVEDAEGIQFVLDTVLPITSLEGGIQKDEVVELVYARDEWEDGTPDYKQAWIVYEVADGQDEMGDVDPTSEVVTLEEVDGEYKKTVTADSTATPAAGNVFVNWTHEDNEVSSRAMLDYEFIAEGGQTYVFTAHFRAGTTGASVDKQLVSYERDGETVTEIPEGFKALVGDVLNYEISVENTGEVALNDIAVSDTLWGNGVDSATVGGAETDVSSGSCTVDVVVDGSVVITYSYTVTAADAGKTITNTATVDLPGDEPGDDPTGEEEVTVDEYGITVTPADITIYMGGDAGYEAVVGENGQVISDNNTLPTPLFTVELSESFGELSVEQIEAIEIAGTTSDAGTRGWRFDYAGKAEDGTDLYYIVPDAGQEPIRVTYTDGEGNAAVSDHFDPATIDELFAEFAIELYTGTVTSVTAEVNGITCKIDYSGTGTLTVRAVDDTDENPVVGVQVALPRPVEAGEGAVTAPAGTTYALNETTVAADAAGVGLLFDGIIDDGADRTGALLAELESELGVTVEDGNYQAQYLDLVDAHNGNAWVKASGAVTVYWGYPEGTGEDTDFALYHFEGLHREGTNSGFDIEDVATSDIERVTITKTANGIAFDISRGGFSPFVLVWDDGDGGDKPWWPPIDPGDDDDDGDDGGDGEFVPKWLNIDDHYAYIIGYEDGTVRPQGNITRAEVATIFFRLLTDEVRAEYWSTVSGYTDVKAGDWYNNAISTLSGLGIITGYEDGTFRPNASISRAEFVTIATRFFDYAAEYEGAFSDVSYSSWYADFVQAAVDMGLVNGYENGTFRPNASITRAEAVAIVNRVLLRRPDADHLLPWSVMNTFSDNVLESAWYYEDIQEATNSHDYEWLKSGVEDWTEKLPERDWAALEREWSKAYDAPGGEVTA